MIVNCYHFSYLWKKVRTDLEKDNTSKQTSAELIASLSPEEQQAIMELNSLKEFAKGYVLISEGQYFTSSFHVVTGLVRQFRVINGSEVTSSFYSDDEFIAPSTYASRETPSHFTFICSEASQINVVSYEQERAICDRFPHFEKMCRSNTEKQLVEYQRKFSRFIASTPEERYRTLMEERPDLLNRVAQYHLSSYLGIKPESLSRIRKRIAEK